MVHQWKLAECMHFTTLMQANAISKQCFTAGQFAMPHFFLCKGQRLRLYIGVSGQSQ